MINLVDPVVSFIIVILIGTAAGFLAQRILPASGYRHRSPADTARPSHVWNQSAVGGLNGGLVVSHLERRHENRHRTAIDRIEVDATRRSDR